MPRKRRTKVVTSSKTKETSNEESSNSGNEDRQNKLDMYIEDFDMKVAKCLIQADNEAKTMCDAINHAFLMELFKLPKNIRNMTRSEFMAQGGSINDTMLHQVTEVASSIAVSISNKALTASSIDSSSDVSIGIDVNGHQNNATAKKKAVRGRKKTTATATASKRSTRSKNVLTNHQDENTQEGTAPQAVRRSTRKTVRSRFVTPAMKTGKAGAMATGWDTPMVTPKFDPRLPVTPSTCVMREVKRGETIMSMSGSPLSMPNEKKYTIPEAVIPLADGTTLKIGTLSPQVDMTMDATTRSNILLLQSNLAKILKKCPVQDVS